MSPSEGNQKKVKCKCVPKVQVETEETRLKNALYVAMPLGYRPEKKSLFAVMRAAAACTEEMTSIMNQFGIFYIPQTHTWERKDTNQTSGSTSSMHCAANPESPFTSNLPNPESPVTHLTAQKPEPRPLTFPHADPNFHPRQSFNPMLFREHPQYHYSVPPTNHQNFPNQSQWSYYNHYPNHYSSQPASLCPQPIQPPQPQTHNVSPVPRHFLENTDKR